MSNTSIRKVLLVEDNPGDARLLREMLNEQGKHDTELTHVESLSDAQKLLAKHLVDIVLLDLGLADAQGLEALRRLHAAAPRIPLVVLTGLDDETMAAQALQEGAQDYLIKGQIEARGLLRAIRYAVERKVMEAQNAQLEGKLRQREKMEALGNLAGGVAHEFNNLLLPIIMTTELVLSELPEKSRHSEMLLRVVDAGNKAAEIVHRILTFGRMDEAAHSILDISAVLREAVALIRTILPSSITLEVKIGENVGVVRGDKTQLTQVLINLASNARDAIGAKVGTVWLSLSRLDTDSERPALRLGTIHSGAYAVFTIRDTGEGMEDATVQRIFEPFFTTKGVGEGTGLGLSVTHGIVTGHGGEIQVDSVLGHGTTFSIYLPVEEVSPALAMAS